ncbi:MAG: hypothetical protein Q4A79_02625 [Candidatus Saccharibacteria bacterium]|nr:hypothetical protein [Candidatus Saccharibacteria bacterium]
MRKLRRFRRGDTIIEVLLAIGIFSMVAIAVVSVINGTTSSAQSSLEMTLTREEINTQAEALRFIRDAYASGNSYAEVWDEITERAIVLNTDDLSNAILNYSPRSCNELYGSGSNSISKQKAFIINPRELGPADKNKIVLKPTSDSNNKFFAAETFPKLIYGDNSANSSLVDLGAGSSISRVEGIFVVAVSETTNPTPSYYDFYIRTCWLPPNSERPATISTVIRLYNPKNF